MEVAGDGRAVKDDAVSGAEVLMMLSSEDDMGEELAVAVVVLVWLELSESSEPELDAEESKPSLNVREMALVMGLGSDG